jgi:hypothetical protein
MVEEVDTGEGEGTVAGAGGGAVEEKRRKKKKGKKEREEEGPEKLGSRRGIETMFRTSYATHVDMSALADNKANIMISINGIIVSIVLASIAPRLATDPALLWPASVLLVGCLTSLVYAVLAARPRVTRRPLTLHEVRENAANILFFGSFVNLREEEFVTAMRELLLDTDRLYGNMIRDIYSLGGVLERKFRLLRTSYTVFMIGLVLGVGLFLVVFARMSMAGAPPTVP